MTQTDLFDSGAPRFARARRSDPASSHAAASHGERSKALAAQMAQVKAAVNHWAGHTSRELAKHMKADRYMVARRLPELERHGVVRKGAIRDCGAGGRAAVTWWPI